MEKSTNLGHRNGSGIADNPSVLEWLYCWVVYRADECSMSGYTKNKNSREK